MVDALLARQITLKIEVERTMSGDEALYKYFHFFFRDFSVVVGINLIECLFEIFFRHVQLLAKNLFQVVFDLFELKSTVIIDVTADPNLLNLC